MKRPETAPNGQMNLSLLDVPATTVPDDKQKELTQALKELLMSAARENVGHQENGGENESETHS